MSMLVNRRLPVLADLHGFVQAQLIDSFVPTDNCVSCSLCLYGTLLSFIRPPCEAAHGKRTKTPTTFLSR
jgi:hypothetical protein